MTKINFITSFNETIYNTVGNHLIKSIKTNWEPSIKLNNHDKQQNWVLYL